MTASVNTLRHEAEQHQHRVRELEEQIQGDDRVERLEISLKNTQDRADELEFQLSKLKQARPLNLFTPIWATKRTYLGSYYSESRTR